MSQKFDLEQSVSYQDAAVVSKTLVKNPAGTITVFAFDRGQELSEHSAPFDAFVQVLDGRAEIMIGGKPHLLESGEAIVMPADIPHAVRASEKFKMMLVMVRG